MWRSPGTGGQIGGIGFGDLRESWGCNMGGPEQGERRGVIPELKDPWQPEGLGMMEMSGVRAHRD